eukprot:932721-Karenia_brevis.AAC.1
MPCNYDDDDGDNDNHNSYLNWPLIHKDPITQVRPWGSLKVAVPGGVSREGLKGLAIYSQEIPVLVERVTGGRTWQNDYNNEATLEGHGLPA